MIFNQAMAEIELSNINLLLLMLKNGYQKRELMLRQYQNTLEDVFIHSR